MAKNEAFHAFAYIEGKNPDQLKALHKSLKLGNVALCVIADKDKSTTLAGYNINPKAKSTIIVYNSRLVTKTFTNYEPKKDHQAFQTAIASVCKR